MVRQCIGSDSGPQPVAVRANDDGVVGAGVEKNVDARTALLLVSTAQSWNKRGQCHTRHQMLLLLLLLLLRILIRDG